MKTNMKLSVLELSARRISNVGVLSEHDHSLDNMGWRGIMKRLAGGARVYDEYAYDIVLWWAWAVVTCGGKPPAIRADHVGLAVGLNKDRCSFHNYVNNCLGIIRAYDEDYYVALRGDVPAAMLSQKVINKKFRQESKKGVQLQFDI